MALELIDLLKALVRIPSPNPPGDTRAIAAYIAETMRQGGCSVTTVAPPSKPEAPSVIATLGSGDPVIMLHAHIDTVPVAETEAKNWSVDPYAAIECDGCLYGKGSVDDKAPLAAMMMTLLHAAQREKPLNGTLILAAAAEEEVGGQLGTRWLADQGHLPPCDFIIVGEQTHNQIATAHKGVVRATVRVTGKSVHATNPERGINAITAMAKVVLALDAYHRSLAQCNHPLVGTPTCNVGVIHGGSTANAVPDSCVVHLDRRMIPGEDPLQVQEELRQVIASVNVQPAQVTISDFLVSNWFNSSLKSALSQTFAKAVGAFVGDPGPIGYMPGSDAKHLTGITRGEMVVFGPGSYEVAHAYDEYVDLAELNTTAQILTSFVDAVL